MSNLQFGTLKFIATHDVTVDDIPQFNLTTLGSILVHGWVNRIGKKLDLTKAGSLALELYTHAGPNYRQHPTDISDRVRFLLHMRSLQMAARASGPVEMKKAG